MQHLPAGRDRVLQRVGMERAGTPERALGQAEVAALEGARGLLEDRRQRVEERSRGAAHDHVRVARQQGGDGEGDEPAEERVEEAGPGEPGARELDRDHEERRARRLGDEQRAPAQGDGGHHRAATTAAICSGPVPISTTSASAMPIPRAMPSSVSIALRRRWPSDALTPMRAATGAKIGRAWPSTACASTQASAVASAACPNQPRFPRRRSATVRGRERSAASSRSSDPRARTRAARHVPRVSRTARPYLRGSAAASETGRTGCDRRAGAVSKPPDRVGSFRKA